jgi:hypothetical protein
VRVLRLSFEGGSRCLARSFSLPTLAPPSLLQIVMTSWFELHAEQVASLVYAFNIATSFSSSRVLFPGQRDDWTTARGCASVALMPCLRCVVSRSIRHRRQDPLPICRRRAAVKVSPPPRMRSLVPTLDVHALAVCRCLAPAAYT